MLAALDDLKIALDIDNDDDDAFLTTLIRQMSGVIETYCRRSFGVKTYEQIFRLGPPTRSLPLKALPVIQITQIKEDQTILAADDYDIDDKEAGLVLRLAANGQPIRWAASKITIAYKAGYNLPNQANPDPQAQDLPADLELCCIDLCAAAYHGKGRDPMVRSLEIDDVATTTFFDPNSAPMRDGVPDHIAARLDAFRLAQIL